MKLTAPSRDSWMLMLAGAVSALGFEPLKLWPLTLVGFACLMWRAFQATRARQAFSMGWTFALAHGLVGLNWIAESFTHQEAMPTWLGWLGVLLVSAYLALYPGLACALAWRLSRLSAPPSRLGWVLLFSASWMLCEWARAGVLGGFAWNPLANVWLALPSLAQGAKWIGPYGMSGMLLLIAGALGWGAQRHWRITAGIAAVALPLGYGLTGFGPPAPPLGIPVHIVQPNINEDEKHDPDLAGNNLLRYAELSVDPHGAPRLLLWPEGALLNFLDHDRKVRVQLSRLLKPGDILLTGGPSVVLAPKEDEDIFHNSVFALDSAAQLPWRYDKAHLVPFGEFLPARPVLSLLGLSRLVPGDGDFSPGPGPRTFEIPGFRVKGQPLTAAVQICYEIIFPGAVVDEAHRPSFLFNPSNDAWFGGWGPPQHLAHAQLRAIEEGLPIIRATPNGISAVISPLGQVLARIPRGEKGVLDIPLPAALPPTLFSRLGLWTSGLVGLCLGAAGLAISLGRVRLPRPRTLAAPPAQVTRQ